MFNWRRGFLPAKAAQTVSETLASVMFIDASMKM